jgi:DNA repair protein SbcD/Mre11
MRSRILHLADLHLGDTHGYLGPLAAARQAEADDLLRRIADTVLSPDSSVGGVIIAGDLFDTWDPAPSLIESVLRDLRRLTEAGVCLLTVPGNHDELSYPGCVYRREGPRWPGVLVTEPEPVRVASWTLGGTPVDLYSMAFVEGRSRPPFDSFEIVPGPARKIAVLHGSLDLGKDNRSLPLRSASLAALDLDYVALGHLHRPDNKKAGRAWATYPGRIEGGGFDDPGGAGLVEIDPAEVAMAPRRSELPSRRIEDARWNITGFETLEALEAKLEETADKEKILRLRLEGTPGFALDADRLRRRWAERFYFLELSGGDGAIPQPALESLMAERTIRGTFASMAARALEDASGDPERTELLRMAMRYGLDAFAAAGPEGEPE